MNPVTEFPQARIASKMFRKAGPLAICLTLFGCAVEAPNEQALVKDEATAIAIGKKACAENHGNVMRVDPHDQKWTADFAKDGYWWVQKSFGRAPPEIHSWAVGLMVRVSAMSGEPGACDIVTPTEE
jgi:hypothetical protein